MKFVLDMEISIHPIPELRSDGHEAPHIGDLSTLTLADGEISPLDPLTRTDSPGSQVRGALALGLVGRPREVRPPMNTPRGGSDQGELAEPGL